MEQFDASARVQEVLVQQGAEALAHPGGTLLAHLIRTEARLRSWGADDDVALAGLCHAAYGTDGFPDALWDIADRSALVALIGTDAEAIVYLYCSCDRQVLHPQIGVVPRPLFRDRFTGATRRLTDTESRAFVAVAVANEVDIAATSSAWATENGPALAELFHPWEQLMPPTAIDTYRTVFAPPRPVRSTPATKPVETVRRDDP